MWANAVYLTLTDFAGPTDQPIGQQHTNHQNITRVNLIPGQDSHSIVH